MNRISRLLLCLPVVLTLSSMWLTLGVLPWALAELPQISDAHIIQPPPGAKVAAAFFALNNQSEKALSITNVRSEGVTKSELHLSRVVDDVARMEKQDSIVIAPGASLEFKHGSYHVMLMGLEAPLEAGNSLSLVLETNAGPLSVDVPIITPDEAAAFMQSDHSMSNDHSKDHGENSTIHNMRASDAMKAGTPKQ